MLWQMSRGVDRSAFKIHLWGRSPFLDMCVLNLHEFDTSTPMGQMQHRIIRESVQWARDQPQEMPRIIKTHLPLCMLPPNLLNTAKGKQSSLSPCLSDEAKRGISWAN